MGQITALMDNLSSENKGLTSEHGLSLLIEKGNARILFDCGASDTPLKNARRLGKDLHHLSCVVLSHSHYDHACGYRDLIEQGMGSSVLYTGPHFFKKKYAFDGICYTDLSCGFDESFLNEHGILHKECNHVVMLAEGIWAIGNFPRLHSFEQIPERFVCCSDTNPIHLTQDDFSDEICIAIDTKKGIIVLLGCSHPGVLNMVQEVHRLLQKPIYAIFGGTHLVEAAADRVDQTLSYFKEMGVELLGLSHCTGMDAENRIRTDHSVKSCHMAVGNVIFFE